MEPIRVKDAQAALDAAVLAARLDRGEPVTAPGLPQNNLNPDRLVKFDCIRPPDLPGLGTGREKAEFEAGHFYMAKEESPPYGKA